MLAAQPAVKPEPVQSMDIGALWSRVTLLAETSPRDQAMLDSFEPVSWIDGLLTVRHARGGATLGNAITDMLSSLATRAAGRPARIEVQLDPVKRIIETIVLPKVKLSGAVANLRDDPIANHPLVREVSALFDATIVRIEAHGTIPLPTTDVTEEADESRFDLDSLSNGDPDV